MTTVHAEYIGSKALVPRAELEQLLELARRTEAVELEIVEDDLPTIDMMRLAERGGAFDFWKEEGEDVYSLEDGEPV